MNRRDIEQLGGKETWPLAGDNIIVDFDLSQANLPVGKRLRVGTAVLEITAEPHLGCQHFKARFGAEAVMFVNSDAGKALNARGVNARVVTNGVVCLGDALTRL